MIKLRGRAKHVSGTASVRDFLFLFSAVIFFFCLNSAAISHAMDSGGCLTCHQYPGLARMEKTGELRVFHIDEEKYRNSSHGDLDCRQCHSKIETVPHQGETVVSCSAECHDDIDTMEAYDMDSDCSECHPDNDKRVKLINLYLKTFHSDEHAVLADLYSSSSCRVCHPLYPHKGNREARAYINLHTGFVTCEVCHLRNNQQTRFKVCGACHLKRADISYDWGGYENAVFRGGPFGRYRKNMIEKPGILQTFNGFVSKLKSKLMNIVFLVEEPSNTREPVTDYAVSRISAFTMEGGRKKILINTWDRDEAIAFRSKEHYMRPSVKRRKLRYFHRDVARQDISVVCNECHSPDSMIDFKKLGFDDVTSKRLKNINIKGLVTKYKTFYFPNFLRVGPFHTSANKAQNHDMYGH